MNKNQSAVFSYPLYFAFCLSAGIFAWSFSFDKAENQPVQTEQMSSLAETSDNSLSREQEERDFEEQLKELQSKSQTNEENDSYTMSPDDIENYEKLSAGILDSDAEVTSENFKQKDLQQNFKYQNVSEADLGYLVTYEDPKACGDKRNYVEKSIANNLKVAEWSEERISESNYLPRKCVSFALNSFPEASTKEAAIDFKKTELTAFGKCSHGSKGAPDLDKKGDRIKHPVPCVSKNFVNMTYNAFADVTACLNLNPKILFPKIYSESGFFMNALGSGMDGGVGQLTRQAIDQVNSIYPKYIEQIAQAAAAKPDGACARIMKHKALITPAKSDTDQRCSLMWPSENPLRNILYMGLLTRYNIKYVSGISYIAGADMIVDEDRSTVVTGTEKDELAGKMRDYETRKKLAKLGLKSVNLHQFKMMIVLAGYNSGISAAMNTFDAYLDERIAANTKSKSTKYNLTLEHFNFESTKDLVKEARGLLMSSFVKPKDDKKTKIEKIKRRKLLPTAWATAYTKTFPEYLTLRMNTYKGGYSAKYQIYGFPGYLNALVSKNKMIRTAFQSGGVDPNYCSSETFLKFK